MKKYFILPAFLAITTTAFSQQPVMVNNPFPKTITVTGSAEMDVIPDEIYVNVFLREYQKKGESKKNIETIKSDFLNAARASGIADSLISIAAYSGFNDYNWIRKRKKDPNLMSTIVYQVKFRNNTQMDALVDKLDDEATENFMIVKVSHSKLNEYRKQLKIAAVKAAREKAMYLTSAVDEKLGDAVNIEEPREPSFGLPEYALRGRMAGANVSMLDQNFRSPVDSPSIDFRKITLRFDVNVIYALQ